MGVCVYVCYTLLYILVYILVYILSACACVYLCVCAYVCMCVRLYVCRAICTVGREGAGAVGTHMSGPSPTGGRDDLVTPEHTIAS